MKGNKKPIPFIKKRFLFLLFLLLNTAFLRAQNFIKEIPEERAKLSEKSKSRIEKLKGNKNITSIKFIEFEDLRKNQHEGKIRFKLPGIDEDVELITIRMEFKSDSVYNWYATTKDGIGSVIILRDGTKYTGHFSLGGKREFQILSEDNQHILVRMKPSVDGEKFCDATPTEKEKKNNDKPKVISGARIEECWDPIRVLVLWTQNAEDTGLTPNDVISTAISQFNSSIYRSDITSAAVLTLAGSQRVNFTETDNNMQDDWGTLASDATIQNLRNNANADIVVLLTDGNYGYANGTVGNFSMNANSAYAIVEIGDAVGDKKVFAHEVGHLFDARHDNDYTGPSYAHSYTIDFPWYTFTADCYTMMHPNSSVGRVENFSNPNVQISGEATGTLSINNNARRISEIWSTVRNHRPSVSTLSAYIYGPTYCNLYQSYTWEAATRCGQGTISYEWFTSYDGFSWSYRSSSEFFTEVFYNGGNSYRYLKLRVTANGQVNEAFSTIYVQGNSQGYRIATQSDKNAINYVPPIVWKKPNSVDEIGKISLAIEQIYPNPSQTTFSLNFDNPIEQDISLDLIDITGQTVNLFTNERYKEGKYSKTLDVSNMLSGTYIVKLSSDIASATTKLVISK